MKNKLGRYVDKSYICTEKGVVMNFKSLQHLLDYFKDEKTGVKYYEKLRWNGNPICPHCKSDKPYIVTTGYKCSNNKCYKKFTVKVGTIFECSKIPFRIWFAVIYLCTTNKKGMSSHFVARTLGIEQKTAWYVLQRIRIMLRAQMPELIGTAENFAVEIDETFVGGKSKNKHTKKKRSNIHPHLLNDGSPYKPKNIVVAAIQRNGLVRAEVIKDRKEESLKPFIDKYIPVGTIVNTDDHHSYSNLKNNYQHSTVNHSAKEYVNGSCHTNTVENFFSHFKRMLHGTHHRVSDIHLQHYVDEFTVRFNNRNLPISLAFEKTVANAEGNALCKNITHGYKVYLKTKKGK
ncbi:MAG: IS1595 family transposase [Bacteroidia bacterium]|nr:IS1595 family transposase [Bacteroidia bacterium]